MKYLKNVDLKFLKNNNPLYKNSLYILSATIFNALIGFVFWVIAAKIYPKADLGIVTVIISVISLISLFSQLGFDQSILRFFPNGKKGKIYTSSIVISSILCIIVSLVYIINIDVFSPELKFIQSYILLFIFTALLFPIYNLNGYCT